MDDEYVSVSFEMPIDVYGATCIKAARLGYDFKGFMNTLAALSSKEYLEQVDTEDQEGE